MKRRRGDERKLAAPTSGDTFGKTAAAATGFGGKPNLTMTCAKSYLKYVGERFKDEKGTYTDFIQVMKDFKCQRIDTYGVIERVQELFRGHPDLMLGFNTFLPEGHEIPLPVEEKKPADLDEALRFVRKIKTRFQNDDRAYKLFLYILQMHREGKPPQEVISEVSMLLEGHQDLLGEFTRFYPSASTIPSTYHESSDGPYSPHDGRTTAQIVVKHDNLVDKIPMNPPTVVSQIERTSNSHLDNGLHIVPSILNHDKQIKRANKDRSDRRMIDCDLDTKDFGQYNREMDDMPHKRKRFSRADDIMELAYRGGDKTESFGTCSVLSSLKNDRNTLKSAYFRESNFFENVKGKFGDTAQWELLNCLYNYRKGTISRTNAKDLVNVILGKYPDLMDVFNDFLEHSEQMDEFLASYFNKRHSLRFIGKKNAERDHKNNDNTKRDYKYNEIGMNRFCYSEKGIERDDLNKICSKDTARCKASFSGQTCLPISELDLSNCQRCTPSYCHLPNNYHVPASRHRSKLGASVLNDVWVSVTSGSEDHSFKHMHKNYYEESLFRCEDDRFEMDMLLEVLNATINQVEEMLKKLQENTKNTEDSTKRLSAIHLRCIENLYGDHGLEMTEFLLKNPNLALPVILTRLKQKQEEWLRCRTNFNKVWAEVYAINHHKSLDHRSFYFKLQDPDKVGAKALLAELREINEKKQKENDAFVTIFTGTRWPLIPDMEFVFADSTIHEDLYQIIRHSCKAFYSSTDQADRVMSIWTDFLEPVLGVPPRPQFVDEFEVAEGDGDPNDDGIGSNAKETNLASNDYGIIPGAKVTLTKCDHASTEATVDPQPVSKFAPVSEGDENARMETTEPGGSMNQRNKFQMCAGGFAAYDDLNVEREEAKLPPNPEFEEIFLGSGSAGDIYNAASSFASRPYPGKLGDIGIPEWGAAVGKGADFEGEASVQSSIAEDGENEFEADEGASACESADAEDCSQGKNDEFAEVFDAHGPDGELRSSPISDCRICSVKPLAKYIPSALHDKKDKVSRIFYGTESFFLLFRLHQILYERLLSAKMNCSLAKSEWTASKDMSSSFLYHKFISSLYGLLDGSVDNATFEDDCRATIGSQSYILFTLDKLVYKVVKQLHEISASDMNNKLLLLYAYENSRQTRKMDDLLYHDNVRTLHDGNVIRFESSSDPSRLSVQLMGYGHEKLEPAVWLDPNFDAYLYNDFLSVVPDKKVKHNIFLDRNKRKNLSSYGHNVACEITDDVQTFNGLECKIHNCHFKVTYVLDTEDLLYRKKRRTQRSNSSVC